MDFDSTVAYAEGAAEIFEDKEWGGEILEEVESDCQFTKEFVALAGAYKNLAGDDEKVGELMEQAEEFAMTGEEQNRVREHQRFERKLERAVWKWKDEGKHRRWLGRYVEHHRRRHAEDVRNNRRAEEFDDSPCKHWMNQLDDSPYKDILASIWDEVLPTWALKHPYLMAPGRPCECQRCGGPGVRKASAEGHWHAYLEDELEEPWASR